MKLHIGDVIDDKYRVLRVLGRGAVGAVYAAENLKILRRVAIKVLHQNVRQDSDLGLRFLREAQTAGRVGSDRIVEVLDFGELSNGQNYLVMELLEGQSLRERLKAVGGRLQPNVLLPMMCDLLEGLNDAHQAGVVHRDLKPDNIFLERPRKGYGDFVKILDFGISKFTRSGEEHTRTGVLMGTPFYMAPEQSRGARHVDHRADLYAVGAMVFHALVGRPPHRATLFEELLLQKWRDDAPLLTDIDARVDERLATIVARALARDPDDRYQTAEELQSALLTWLGDHDMPLTAGSRESTRTPSIRGSRPSRSQAREVETSTLAPSMSESETPTQVAQAHTKLLGTDSFDEQQLVTFDKPTTPLASRVALPHKTLPWLLVAAGVGAIAGVAVVLTLMIRVGDETSAHRGAHELPAAVASPAKVEAAPEIEEQPVDDPTAVEEVAAGGSTPEATTSSKPVAVPRRPRRPAKRGREFRRTDPGL